MILKFTLTYLYHILSGVLLPVLESSTKNLTLKSKQERNKWEEDFQNDIINPVIMVLLAELCINNNGNVCLLTFHIIGSLVLVKSV